MDAREAINNEIVADDNASECGFARAKSGWRVIVGLSVMLLGLASCGEVRYEMGRPFDTGMLEASLTVGQSSEADVRAALGEPDGVGRYLAPVSLEPRPMWTYYYETGTAAKQADRTMLFVLFREDRYDGYLWFSDTLLATPTN